MELKAGFRSRDVVVAHELSALKLDLAQKVVAVIRERGVSHVEAERLTGFDRSEFSRIERGRLDLFKLDRLVRILILLGQEVSIDAVDRPELADLQPQAARA